MYLFYLETGSFYHSSAYGCQYVFTIFFTSYPQMLDLLLLVGIAVFEHLVFNRDHLATTT